MGLVKIALGLLGAAAGVIAYEVHGKVHREIVGAQLKRTSFSKLTEAIKELCSTAPKLIKQFFVDIHCERSFSSQSDTGELQPFSPDELTDELIEELVSYAKSLGKLLESFVSLSEQLKTEITLADGSVLPWKNWNYHSRLLFRDIVILADFLVDVSAVDCDRLGCLEYIKQQRARLVPYIEQYVSEESSNEDN